MEEENKKEHESVTQMVSVLEMKQKTGIAIVSYVVSLSCTLKNIIIPKIKGIDGGWGLWSNWSDCSASFGGGEEIRTQLCDNPAPSSGGKHCEGHENVARPCGEVECRSAIEIPTDCGIRKGGNFRVVGGKQIVMDMSG